METFFICLYVLWRLFCIFGFSKVIIFNCTLTPQHTARMQLSGTKIISTCGRVFSCLLLTRKTSCHESQCDTEKNMHGLQNPCVMHRLIYTHARTLILYKEPCVPLTVHVLFVPDLLTFRTARVLICFLLDLVKLFRLMWHVTFIKQTY